MTSLSLCVIMQLHFQGPLSTRKREDPGNERKSTFDTKKLFLYFGTCLLQKNLFTENQGAFLRKSKIGESENGFLHFFTK